MLRLQRRFSKATLYHLHRGIVSTTSRYRNSDTKESKANKLSLKTPLWCAPFIFQNKNKDNENDKDKEQDDNAFISSIMSNNAWLTSKMDWLDLPSVEDINVKLNELYPQFTLQFNHLREGYAKMWDYLTMEEFRKIVEEIKLEEKDPRLYPEMNKDATVR
jgi:hypothetical protein